MGEEDKGGLMAGLKEAGIKIADAFLSNIDPSRIKQALLDVDTGASDVLKTFGASRDVIQAIRQNMANATQEVKGLGGQWQDIVDIQTDVSTALNRNLTLSSDAFEKMYAAAKASGQDYSTITKSFKDVGISVYDSTKQMEGVVNIARASGVNASAVSSQVLTNMEALNKYNFEGGVQGLAKMAAQATSLRIDMKDSLAFAEKVFDPEGAINMAAAMQRLGVAQGDLLDPLRMMDLAQNDPGELQNQIAKMSQQFVQLKKDGTGFEIMPGAKRQMREIEQSMGLPLGQLSKMALASADLDDKMKKIKFPAATDEQKTMIANMAEMKGGQYVVNFTDKEGKAQEKAVTELSKDDLEAMAKASEPKTLEELTKDQLSTEKSMAASLDYIKDRLPYAIAGSKAGKSMTEAPRELMSGFQKTFSGDKLSVKNLSKSVEENSEVLFKTMDKFAKGVGTWDTVTDAFHQVGENTKKTFGGAWTEVMENAKKSTDELGKSQNGIIQLMGVVGKKWAVNEKLTTETQSARMSNTASSTNAATQALKNAQSTTQSTTAGSAKSTVDITIKHDVMVNSNGNINKEQVAELFRSQDFKEKVAEASKLAINNGGLTGGSPDKQKEMNPHIKKE